MVLSYSGAIQESFAEVGFIKRGIALDNEHNRVASPNDTAPFNIGGTYYVVAGGAEGVHLVTVTNPDSLNRNDIGGSVGSDGTVADVDTYVPSDGTTRIVSVWGSSKAVQLQTVSGSGLATNQEFVVDTEKLLQPSGLAIYSPTAGNHYAVVTANIASGTIDQGGSGAGRVNIINLTTPSSISIVTNITDDANKLLQTPTDVAIYSKGSNYYAVVTSSHDNGIQIINITNPNSPVAAGKLADTNSLLLKGASAVDVYSIGNKHYAVVTQQATIEGGLQIIDITDPNNPTGAGKITSNDIRYKGAEDVSVHSYNDRWYALVAGKANSHAVTIIDVTNPNSPVEKAYIKETTERSDTLLREVNNVNTYKQTISGNERHFASVGSWNEQGQDDGGVQILEMVFLTANAGPDQAVLRNSSVTLNGSGSTVTTPGKTITYSWTQTGGPTVQLTGANTASPTFTAPNQVTQLTFRVTTTLAADQNVVKTGHVTNYGIIRDTDTVTVIVSNGPTANAGSDQTVTVGDTVTLRGTAITPNNNPLTYAWTHVSGPTASLSNNAVLQPTFTASSPGTITLRLTITDSTLSATDADTVSIRVIAQQPPSANAGADQTVIVGKTVTLSGSGTDPNGDSLTFRWNQDSGTRVTIENPDLASISFTAPSEPETLEFTLTVRDGARTDTDSITITVKNPPSQTRNIKELKDTLVYGQITEPTQSTDPDQVGGTDLITGSNEITMIYTEPIATFINSYLNFTISGEEKSRNITGINGSPAIETGETVLIDGKQVKTYSTILTFDGPPVPPGSTGSMYVQHADYYLAKIQIRDGQN